MCLFPFTSVASTFAHTNTSKDRKSTQSDMQGFNGAQWCNLNACTIGRYTSNVYKRNFKISYSVFCAIVHALTK